MPDLSGLTDDQRAALREHDHLAAMYQQAVERRVDAERQEREALARLLTLGYRIAGAS